MELPPTELPQSREILTGEEIRELLWDQPPGTYVPRESPRRAEVLFVARRSRESHLLETLLAAAGCEITVVRNPFAALDRIRSSPPQAIVSELELWAEEGSLLLERLRSTHLRLPVLLISPESRNPEQVAARLTRAGAWGVLFRPIPAGDVEQAVHGLLETAATIASESPSKSAVAAPMNSSGPQWTDLEEALCLRFHLELTRISRRAPNPQERSAAVLDEVRGRLSPHSVAIVYRDKGLLRVHLDAASEEEMRRLARLATVADPGQLSSRELEGTLLLGSSSVPRLVLGGLAKSVEAAIQSIKADLDMALDRAVDEPLGR